MNLMPLGFLCCFVLSSFVVASTTWTDGKCGQCYCYKNIGQFERLEYTVNCSKRNFTEIPDNLPSGIHILDLSYNSLSNSSLKNLDFYDERLKKLTLAQNDIKHIEAKVFSSLYNLEELDLTGNILDYVNEKLFVSLNLRILRGFSAKSFDRTSFRRFGGMEILSVVFYQETIPGDIFENLFVFQLDVSFQKATEIPVGLFQFGSNTLTTLSIYAPLLFSLSKDTFKDLTVLKTLTIDGSNIRFLPSNLFHRPSTSSMPIHLYKIRIKGVKAIPRDLLTGQRSLKFATLQNIEDIPPLELPVQLDSLDLAGSNVFSISSSIFSELHNLRGLNLSNTSLSTLEKDVFVGLSSLYDLDLSRNAITHLPTGIFEACRNTLESVNFSYNNLQRITELNFNSVKSLRILNLNYNQINYIDGKSFRNLNSLSVLNIVGNFLRHLPEDLFWDVRSLQVIDLAQNNISKLPAKIFDGYKLNTVNLNDNPLHCDCNLLLMKMDNRFVSFNGICNSPMQYIGVHIMDLKSNESCHHVLFSSTSIPLNSFSQSSSQQSTQPLSTFNPKSLETKRPINTDDIKQNRTSPNCNNFNSTQLETNSLSDVMSCSVEDVTSVSVTLGHPSSESSKIDHWDISIIILYVCATIVAIVLIVLAVLGCTAIFEKYRRSGTYILPPPKSQTFP